MEGMHKIYVVISPFNSFLEENYSNNVASKNIFVILMGDVNRDCKVDIFDLAKVGLCYSCEEGEECWLGEECYKADLSGNDKVDIFDLAMVGLNYGEIC